MDFTYSCSFIYRSFALEPMCLNGWLSRDSPWKTLFTNNEVLFVSKLNYDRPKRGDIVIIQIYEGNWDYLAFFKDIPLFRTLFPSQGEVNYIKRVVGLPEMR